MAPPCSKPRSSQPTCCESFKRSNTRSAGSASERWAARAIDLDLLLHDRIVARDSQLELPHAGLAFRRFVLEPAAEVAADMLHPRIGLTIQELLDHLNHAPPYIAILAADGSRCRTLARRLATATGAELLSDEEPAENRRRLDRWRRMLAGIARDPDCESANRAWLSDFWWNAFPAHLAGAAADDRESLVAAWEQESSRVPRAKLLLVLAAEHELRPIEGPAPETDRAADARRALIRAVLETPGHGPFLHVDAVAEPGDASASLDAAVRIAAAAIDAMR